MEGRPDYPTLRVGDLQVVGELGKREGYDTYLNVRYWCFWFLNDEKVADLKAVPRGWHSEKSNRHGENSLVFQCHENKPASCENPKHYWKHSGSR